MDRIGAATSSPRPANDSFGLKIYRDRSVAGDDGNG
jgi:hypothetical protein